MTVGTIQGLKNATTGYLSQPGRSDIQFSREDFKSDEAWDRDTLIGRRVSFSASHSSNGTNVAKFVRLIED